MYRAINIGTGAGVSVLELISTFENVNNIKIPYQIKDRRSGDVAECYADASFAKDSIDWQAVKTIEDMCRDSYNWQVKNPRGYS